jgi:hypothetical protein
MSAFKSATTDYEAIRERRKDLFGEPQSYTEKISLDAPKPEEATRRGDPSIRFQIDVQLRHHPQFLYPFGTNSNAAPRR